MSNEVDVINRLSYQLEKFSWLGPEKAIFRCPLCGDSKKDPNKTRGAFVRMGGSWLFSCFNGCATRPFNAFLRKFDPQLYKEYRLNRLRKDSDYNFNMGSQSTQTQEKSHVTASKMQQSGSVMDIFGGYYDGVPKLSDLPKTHPARRYFASRKLPVNALDRFYYTDNFNEWAESVNSRQELSDTAYPGIIIPLASRSGEDFGFQCRFLSGPLRYKTIVVDERNVKCYGVDRIDFERQINVFEGVFDSLYVKNSIAALDSSLDTCCDKLMAIHSLPKSQFVLWYDFEKFNKEIIKQKREAVERGFKVVFVDKTLVTHKDINAIVQNSSNPKQTLKTLFESVKVLSGTRAKVELTLNSRTL